MLEEKTSIRLLDDATINKIAAGEVVESASAVVKELIENALDAGSSFIEIETRGGGQIQIVVKDDGIGMSEADLHLAVQRHATSKIKEAEDLYHLSTLGFRGEALAAIGSVSKMRLESVLRGHLEGHSIYIEGGKIATTKPVVKNGGTKVEVSSLFFNLPVRKKFQKSMGKESLEIQRVIVNAALSNFAGFKWIHEGEVQFSILKGSSLLERCQTLLGEEFQGELLEIKGEGVSGWMPPLNKHLGTRRGHYLFVNGRPLTSLFVSKCVEEVFSTRLPVNRYPLFVLHLTCPPDQIDINIHPQKKEVRFSDEERIKKWIQEAVREAFLKKEQVFIPQTKVYLAPSPLTLSYPLEKEEQAVDLPLFEEPKVSISFLKVVGKFLLMQENEGELLFVHAQRAASRIFYDKKEKNEPTFSQNLLFPLKIEKNRVVSKLLEEHLSLFEELGIVIRPFGPTTFCIDAIAPFMSEESVEELIDQILDEVANIEEKRKRALMLLCRKICPKIQTKQEAERLIYELFECRDPSLSPEGKPIFLKVTEKEIGKWLE